MAYATEHPSPSNRRKWPRIWFDRFRWLLCRKSKARRWVVDLEQDLPEPVDKLPSGVLKHWAPRSRCCEEVLEEIRPWKAAAPLNPVPLDDEVAKVKAETGRRNLFTRIRRLFRRTRTSDPEELEVKELRKEKKAVIQYLKERNLYSREMTFEHMKDLKAIAERSFGEIEMKEVESAALEVNPVEVQETELPVDMKHGALVRPEGPLEETDGNQIHPGTGKPISAPIHIPGDIACVQCNPEAIIVQKVITEEPPEKDSTSQTIDAVQPTQDETGEHPSPSPQNPKSWKTLVNIHEEAKVEPIQDEHEPIEDAVTDVTTQEPKEDPVVLAPSPPETNEDRKFPSPPLDDVKSSKSMEYQGIYLTPRPENETSGTPTEDEEPRPPKNDQSYEPKEDEERIPLPPLLENKISLKTSLDQEPSEPPQKYTFWNTSEQNEKPWKTMIIPRSNIHEEAKLDEEQEPLNDELSGMAHAEARLELEYMSMRMGKKFQPRQQITMFSKDLEKKLDEGTEVASDGGVPPPPLPEKKKRKRRNRKNYQRRVNWADVDTVEVADPTTYNQEEEEDRKLAAGSSRGCSLPSNHTPLCLSGLRWKFDEPYCSERLVE